MKQKFTLFLALVFTSLGYAQLNDAKLILDKVSARLQQSKSITANFSYTTKSGGSQDNSVVGKIRIKGNKYAISQGNNQIVSDGSKIWNYNGDKEVMVSDAADADNNTLSPQNLLSGFYEKDFTYKLISSAGNYYAIELIPTDKRKNFKSITIFVNKIKNLITKATVLDKSDNQVQFVLSNIITTTAIPDSSFVFDTSKYPGIEVITQ